MTDLVVPVPLPRRLADVVNRAPTQAPDDTARPWFEIRNAAGDDDTAAELLIYDEIYAGSWWGGGVSATSFADALRAVTATKLTVRINSPGGSVFEGISIANLIRSHPADTTIVVDGLAASIASVIAIAGKRVVMAPQSQMMIHDASGSAWGCNAGEMRELADLLDRQSDNIAAAYRAKAGGMQKSWRGRMQAETWYTADEAVAAGLADTVGTVATGTAGPSTANPDEGMADGWYDKATRVFDLSNRFRFAGRADAPAPDGQPTVQKPVIIDVSPGLTITADAYRARLLTTFADAGLGEADVDAYLARKAADRQADDDRQAAAVDDTARKTATTAPASLPVTPREVLAGEHGPEPVGEQGPEPVDRDKLYDLVHAGGGQVLISLTSGADQDAVKREIDAFFDRRAQVVAVLDTPDDDPSAPVDAPPDDTSADDKPPAALMFGRKPTASGLAFGRGGHQQ